MIKDFQPYWAKEYLESENKYFHVICMEGNGKYVKQRQRVPFTMKQIKRFNIKAKKILQANGNE